MTDTTIENIMAECRNLPTKDETGRPYSAAEMLTRAVRHAIASTEAALLSRIDELDQAIRAHRDAIHGPTYDYEADPAYEPEAQLYRAIANSEAKQPTED